jgi:hypothetical protein
MQKDSPQQIFLCCARFPSVQIAHAPRARKLLSQWRPVDRALKGQNHELLDKTESFFHGAHADLRAS